MSLDLFHPAVRSWFADRFPAGPTPPQEEGWPAIRSGAHTLIAAPTGAGKTLAAFLSAIDDLLQAGLTAETPGVLPAETRVLYVSPLKALGNDVAKNLAEPLAGIRAEVRRRGLPDVEIAVAVRTGDTPSHVRRAQVDRPPHLFVTTPESLFILLTTERGRRMLRTVRTVIVDEIHAVAGDRRGAHLALSLERLSHLVRTEGHGAEPVRIGLSATQEPIEEIAGFLAGADRGAPRDVTVIDFGHLRETELAIEIPDSPLTALASGEMWEEIYDRLAEIVRQHRTTLVFVNTRRMAERVARHLSGRLGEEAVTAHHGSLSRARRLDAEERLKSGRLRALVATASLELGIDVGSVDVVCQLGSPHSIAALLQRVGRSGRTMGSVARGRLFPLSRDDLIECAALLRAVRAGRLDRLVVPKAPRDVLAQQLVAMAADGEWDADEMFALVRRAGPYRDLPRERFDAVLRMLSDGYAADRGTRSAWLGYDEIHGKVRGRRGARLAATTSGGAIPDVADYDVVVDPEGTVVGTINEDFAVESLAGDVFQLGNTSWRILKVESGRVRVADAKGQPPTMPFWLGEAPARTDELSLEVSRLRRDVGERLADGPDAAVDRLVAELGLSADAARQIVEYLAATRDVLGVVPSQETLVLERFFDEAGGMQLVIHAPFGSRINRAFGLALRKRFCRGFDFELQAAADEDAIVLSLGPAQSFPLADVFRYLRSDSVRDLLVQALLAAPMFPTRWRWNAGRALAVLRFRNGRRVPAPLLRMRAEDLLVAVFPQAAACLENVVGDVEPPDHPLVAQTLEDCLTEAMDVDGLVALLRRMEAGAVTLVARDVTEPSPMAHEILSARPYAFLDDAPAEERRTLAVSTRRTLDFKRADDLGRLDPEAIAAVREEAWPVPEGEDEIHDALLWLGVATEREAAPWAEGLARLEADRRATRVTSKCGRAFFVAAERLPEIRAVFGEVGLRTAVEPPARLADRAWDRGEALAAILRGRLEGLGPTTAERVAESLGIEAAAVHAALVVLESEGIVLRGRFTPAATVDGPIEWCHRRLLARIHRRTIDRLRSEIEPVAPADYMRFLFAWQGLQAVDRPTGPAGVLAVLRQLGGFEAPAADWEAAILPARVRDYTPEWLDRLCMAGEVAWGRLVPPPARPDGEGRLARRTGPVRNSPITIATREAMADLLDLAPGPAPGPEVLRHEAQAVYAALKEGGPAFPQDLPRRTGLLPEPVERGLADLAAWGLATADGFAALRRLVRPSRMRHEARRRRAAANRFGIAPPAGRWSLLRPAAPALPDREAAVERHARILLDRYGVVMKRVTEREPRLVPWREILYALRRMELRGEVRGGRFVAGFSGEQFALPDAVERLRAMRRRKPDGTLTVVSGGDPLNLAGIVTAGDRVPAVAANRVLYRDGTPIAMAEGGQRRLLTAPAGAEEEREIDRRLTAGRGA